MSQDVILQSKVLYVWIWDKNGTDTTVHLFYHIKNGKFWVYHQQQDNSIRCYANNPDEANLGLANLDYIPISQCKKYKTKTTAHGGFFIYQLTLNDISPASSSSTDT